MSTPQDPTRLSAQEPALAFIGLGHMGMPMATNLAKAGLKVSGFDVVEEACEKARDNGIDASTDLAKAVEGATVVWTMLPNGDLVRDTITKAMELLPEGTLFIDSSTISVVDAQALGKLTSEKGYYFIDAPVSGGVVGASAGTLAFMVGGGEDAIQRAYPLLDILGGSITHCGPVGSGQTVKICNNLVLGVQQIVVAESMILADRLGIDPKTYMEVVSNSTGSCWALTKNCPVPGPVPESPANHDYQPGYASALMLKDLRLAKEVLEQTGTTANMGMQAWEMYETFCEQGNAGLDFSAIIRLIDEKKNN